MLQRSTLNGNSLPSKARGTQLTSWAVYVCGTGTGTLQPQEWPQPQGCESSRLEETPHHHLRSSCPTCCWSHQPQSPMWFHLLQACASRSWAWTDLRPSRWSLLEFRPASTIVTRFSLCVTLHGEGEARFLQDQDRCLSCSAICQLHRFYFFCRLFGSTRMQPFYHSGQ